MPDVLTPTRLLCLFSLALSACASTATDTPTATQDVYVSAKSLQCQGGGRTLAEMQAKLVQAGVTVQSASCGADGRMRTAQCGGGDGRILIYTVPAAQAAAASAAGFRPLASLPDASRQPCR